MLDSYSKFIMGIGILFSMGCSTTSGGSKDPANIIENPFGTYGKHWDDSQQSITFKTAKGDASYEVSVPNSGDSDIVLPFAQHGKTGKTTSKEGIDYQYADTKPTMADREIASVLSKSAHPESEAKRQEIEADLGLQAAEDQGHLDQSYLAKIDVVKQLFHAGRFEAALIEVDQLIKEYPNYSRLYEMRGTVYDRLGYTDLAVKSWRQALEFAPSRLGLKKLIEKRERQRSVASEKR